MIETVKGVLVGLVLAAALYGLVLIAFLVLE